MFRCMLGSVKGVKSGNPKGKGKLENGKGDYLKIIIGDKTLKLTN